MYNFLAPMPPSDSVDAATCGGARLGDEAGGLDPTRLGFIAKAKVVALCRKSTSPSSPVPLGAINKRSPSPALRLWYLLASS